MLAELALDTILLLRQLVLCTYTLFGILTIHLFYGRVVIAALDFDSDGRGLDSYHQRPYVSARYFYYNIHDIFSSAEVAY